MHVINNEYILPITYNCNWKCKYCIVDTHNQKPLNIDKVLENIKSIPCNSIVHLEGGEPGMLDKKDLMIIINNLQLQHCKLFLNTNGLFLEKYPELLHYMEDVLYHCIEDLSSRKEIVLYNDVTYMLVVDDDTLEDLEWYLNKYPITFFVSRAIPHPDVKYKSLSKKNALYLIKNYKMHNDSVKYLLG